MTKIVNSLLVTLLLSVAYSGKLCAQDTHWSVNIYDYEYDMTAYIALTADGESMTDYDNYELAAFCGEECRGVATIQTTVGNSYCYLRIRSNQSAGEAITFKVYVKNTEREVDVEDFALDFVSQSVQGLPSSPVVLDFKPYIPGDADGDGEISVFDVVSIMDYVLEGEAPDGFIAAAADFNGDGEVDVFDIVELMDYILNQ